MFTNPVLVNRQRSRTARQSRTSERLNPRRDAEVFVVCCLVVVLAFVLEVQPNERVGVPFLGGWQIPGLCLMRELFGETCPGCGLTRSFILAAHGDLGAAYQTHRVGPLFAILVAIQLPYRIYLLRIAKSKWPSSRVCVFIANLLIGMLIVNWLIGVLP